ncbi:cellulase family glycosylhydrolase [Nakamurella flavida]|uniref:Endoglucanase n=1 Tax=Nakamurella flavida TaxID=363630 RepID=A0A939C457_9ACTN|nr:cellulase family glycosylhydrolase [Nakamurella flavida]
MAVFTLAVTVFLGVALSSSPRVEAAVTTPGYLHTNGSAIVTESGTPVTLKAVNWFGMETSNCAPHGLWQISLDQGLDRIAAFGFTTLRLPFSNECLRSTAPVSGIEARNPELAGRTPLQVMDAVVAEAGARGMQVILDRHRPDSGSQSELWYTSRYSEKDWIDDWVMLAKRYAGNPTVIGADLHNEPRGSACWGCGDAARDWAAAATRAGNAVLAANPRWLVIVEGVERSADGSTTWWGGNLRDTAAKPIQLAVKNQLVYSAHDYPASVFPQTWFADPAYPANLPAVWDRSWGYLAKQNIAPVLLGEFGTKLETESDRAWLRTLVGYLGENRISFAFWSFNPNSGDTGGLVADDWVTPQQAKLDALAPLLGAAPGPTSAPTTTAGTTAPTTTKPSTTAPTTTKPSTTAPTTTKPSTTAPTTTKPSTTAPTTPPTSTPASGKPSVTWTRRSAWNDGYVADVTVRASGALPTWTVSWADPSAVAVTNAWGMSCSVGGGRITCTGSDWARSLPAGGTATVGLQVRIAGPAPERPVLTVS